MQLLSYQKASRSACTLLGLMSLTAAALASPEPEVFLVDGGYIVRIDSDGTATRIWEPAIGSGVNNIAVSSNTSSLFWTEHTPTSFASCLWKGTITAGVQIEWGMNAPQGEVFRAIALDENNGFVFWASSESGGSLWKASYAGTNVQQLSTNAGQDILGLEFEPSSDRLYWTSQDPGSGMGTIRWVDAGGGSGMNLLENLDEPYSLAVNTSGSLFWTEAGSGRIRSIEIASPGAIMDVYTELSNPRGLSECGNTLYWSERDSDTVSKGPATGGTVTTIASELFSPTELKLFKDQAYAVPTISSIVWVSALVLLLGIAGLVKVPKKSSACKEEVSS